MSDKDTPSSHTLLHDQANTLTQPLDTILATIEEMFKRKQSMTKPLLTSLKNQVEQMKGNIITFLYPLAASQPNHQQNKIPSKSYAAVTSTSKPKRVATPTIVVKKEENTNSAEVINKVSKFLTESKSDANILKTSTNKKGDTLLRLQSSAEDITALADNISKELGFTAKGQPLIQPKMTLTHIPSHVEINNDLRQQLIDNNSWLNGPLQHGGEMEVLFHYKPKDLFSAVLKMSPDVRIAILEHGSLNIGNRACPVKDRFHVRRCAECYAFGHRSTDCQQETDEKCGHCLEEHKTSSCPNKTNATKLRCSLCPSGSSHHSTFDTKCPQYRREIERLVRITNYGCCPPSF